MLYGRIRDEILDLKLEDDDTEYGGVSFVGETLRDFLEGLCIPFDTPIMTVNKSLKQCGIKSIMPGGTWIK